MDSGAERHLPYPLRVGDADSSRGMLSVDVESVEAGGVRGAVVEGAGKGSGFRSLAPGGGFQPPTLPSYRTEGCRESVYGPRRTPILQPV